MADLIVREALGIGKADPKVFTAPEYAYGWNSAIEAINAAPAVDAVEVVRCGECIYSNSCEIEGMLLGDGIENPYCAGGERRGENEPWCLPNNAEGGKRLC